MPTPHSGLDTLVGWDGVCNELRIKSNNDYDHIQQQSPPAYRRHTIDNRDGGASLPGAGSGTGACL